MKTLASLALCLCALCACAAPLDDEPLEDAVLDVDARADDANAQTTDALEGIETTSIFRQPVHPIGTFGDWSYLKIKGELAEAIKNAMTGAAESCDARGRCARKGEHILCVPPNAFEPTVCEIRFTRTRNGETGALTSPREDFDVYHSAELNRHYGTSFVEDGFLVFEGDSADALENALRNGKPRIATGATPSRRAYFEIVDIATGTLCDPSF